MQTAELTPIKIKVLAPDPKAHDWEKLKAWLTKRGVPFTMEVEQFTDKLPWRNYVAGEKHVDESWFDANVAWRGGKSDILLVLTYDWKSGEQSTTIGYAKPEQRLGQYRAYVWDEQRSTTSTINFSDRVLRVCAHELCHVIYAGCGREDRTHELDYSDQSEKLLADLGALDYKRFRGFVVKDGLRMFALWSDGRVTETIVYDSIAKLFASGFNYWRRVFKYRDEIPKPLK